jgi:hypothetical protein
MLKHGNIAGALVILMGLSSAQAATGVAHVDSIQGKVLVNRGAGFVPAGEITSLNPGDKVFVGKDASAKLSYAGGCGVMIASSTIVTVQEIAPCAAGETIAAVESGFVKPTYGTVVGAGAGAAYVPIVLSVSAIVVGLTTAHIATHSNGGTPVSAP